MSMHPPPDPDELASDLVDGLLPADQAARLRSDPAIAARVEAIEMARAALRVPPPSPPGAVDRALAATFAALDRGTLPRSGAEAAGANAVTSSGEHPPPPVTHLRSVGGGPSHSAKPRPNKSSRSGSMPWLAAAAAIVFLGLVTIGILSTESNSNDSTGDAAVSSDSDTGGGGEAEVSGPVTPQDGDGSFNESADQESANDDGPPAASGAPTTASTETSSGRSSDLGAVDNAAELADRIRAGDEALGAGADVGSQAHQELGGLGSEDSTCPGLSAIGDPTHGESVYVADAVLAGAQVRVHLYDDGQGNLRLVATDRACVDVVDVPYSG